MSNTESQKKGSSSEDKDQVNPKMPLRMKVSLSTLRNQGEIIPATEGDGESPTKRYLALPRKKRKTQRHLKRYASRQFRRRLRIIGKSQIK